MRARRRGARSACVDGREGLLGLLASRAGDPTDGRGDALTFEGGTSLSKGWKLIQRFSEDIDLVVDKARLGFAGGERPDGPESLGEGKGKARDRQVEKLASACDDFVRERLFSQLRDVVDREVADGVHDLRFDDASPATLLYHYPTAIPPDRHVAPVVKLELGARSDTEPSELVRITTFIHELEPTAALGSDFDVRAVKPVRTLVEKLMLLHEERMRAASEPPARRLSRHYYDVWHLVRAGIGAELLEQLELFQRVAAHREVYFRKSEPVRASLRRGELDVEPLEPQMADWRRDYEAMRETMFLDRPPPFDELVSEVLGFQRELVERLRERPGSV